MRALAALGIFLFLVLVVSLFATGERYGLGPPTADETSTPRIEEACRARGMQAGALEICRQAVYMDAYAGIRAESPLFRGISRDIVRDS